MPESVRTVTTQAELNQAIKEGVCFIDIETAEAVKQVVLPSDIRSVNVFARGTSVVITTGAPVSACDRSKVVASGARVTAYDEAEVDAVRSTVVAYGPNTTVVAFECLVFAHEAVRVIADDKTTVNKI